MGSRKGYIIDGIGVNMTTALATIFVFGLIVFIHELGHFITAKMSGMQVDEFAIGFGPAIFKVQRGETFILDSYHSSWWL